MYNCISSVKGFEFIDSRGNPTVAAEVILAGGEKGFAISPSGASTGIYEAHELRDNDVARFDGKGVKKAVQNVNTAIKEALTGMEIQNQLNIDKTLIELDGTENKSNLGANAILAVSLAAAKAGAKMYNLPLYKYLGGINAVTLPRPMMNILNGGAHAKNNVDIQEFMVVPYRSESFAEGLRQCCEIYKTLGKILQKFGAAGVGDEGGFAPNLNSDEEAIEIICDAIEKTGYSTDNFKIALDVASSEWYTGDGMYRLPKRNVNISSQELVSMYEDYCSKYPITSIEDGLGEEDWSGWKILTERLSRKIQLVGDDLFVTNPAILKKGIEKGIANSVLVKPNQIGTLSETLEVVRMAQKSGYAPIISHRSGESEDTTIADIAVGLNAGQIKTGAPCRTDRVAKYNRLLIIEKELYK